MASYKVKKKVAKERAERRARAIERVRTETEFRKLHNDARHRQWAERETEELSVLGLPQACPTYAIDLGGNTVVVGCRVCGPRSLKELPRR